MKYSLLILSLLLIIGFTFYYLKYCKTLEKFQASLVKLSQTDKCNFVPWGHSRQGCINRCASDDKEYWGGDACDLQNCRKICDECNNETRCKWKSMKKRDAPVITEQVPPKLSLNAIAGDAECLLLWENINNDSNKNTSFIIKWFKTYNIDEGVNVETIRISEQDKNSNKRNYKHKISNLDNNETYSIVIFASNTYTIGEPSSPVIIKPTVDDKIMTPA